MFIIFSKGKMSSKALESSDDAERNQLDEFMIENEAPVQAEIEPPPDGGYGWICVAACFNINCFTWGVVSVRDLSPLTILDLG